MVGPDSSYSPLEIHICWKVLSEDRIEPPIHSEYLRSGVATTLIFIVDGARAVIPSVMRSTMPSNRVVPPDARAAGFLAISLDTMLTMLRTIPLAQLLAIPLPLAQLLLAVTHLFLSLATLAQSITHLVA